MSSDNKNNVPGVGGDYEIYISAHFALNLICNKNVKDFSIRSNAEDFGNFDDVVIDITLQDGTSENYAIQLKHKQKKDKKLIPSNFEAKGDFHIEKYCKEFKKLSEEKKQKYHFLLYTNLKFNTQSKNESKLFNVLDIKECQGSDFFNTDSSGNALYKFEAKKYISNKEDYDSFLPKVTLYTSQGDVDTIKNKILKFFSSEENLGLSYIDLFRKWHQGKFTNKTINRETVLFHVTNILLSKGLISDLYLPTEKNLKLFEEAVRLFDVTLVKDSANMFIENLNVKSQKKKPEDKCLVELAKKIKLINKDRQTLDKYEEEKIWCYFLEKLLIINSRQVSNEVISKVTDLYRNKKDEVKLIVLCETAITSLQCSVFQNLEDIRSKNEDLYNKITATCQVSLQGQDEISLCEFAKNFKDIGSSIETKEIFNILKEDYFLIGEEKETLPAYYIDRKFSITVLDFDSLVKCIKDENNIVILNSQNVDEKQFNNNRIVVTTSLSEFFNVTSSNKQTSIISTDEENINKLFEEIVKQEFNKHVHYFKTIQDKFFLIKSTKNIFLSNNYNLEKKILDEKNINSILNVPINIICAEPGMGKTTTMNYLKNNCPNNFWTIGIDLKSHNSFLKNELSFENVLQHFLNTEDKMFVNKLKENYLNKKQIFFFFDGLDELDSDSLRNILYHIKELSEKGFRVWVSSRQNLQRCLETTFDIFITDIVELNQDEQKRFIKDRLKDRYNEDEIELLTKKMSTNTRIINNQHFLGIPLQLYIITQIFLDQKFYVDKLEENMFVLTKMYRHFFEGRYEHFSSKLSLTNMREIEVYLEDYELIALQIVFDSDVLKKNNLDLRRSERCLKKVKEEKDPLGIIVKLDTEGKAVFEHYTYAEYFVCSYLRNNFEKAKLLKEQLFSDQYKNLMLMFSIMLAEESPLHLAVIYKDHTEIEQHIGVKTQYDFARRNSVGLASCNFENVERGRLFDTEEHAENIKIMKALITKFNPYEKDFLFGLDSFQYAVLRRSLFALELILENFGMTYEAFVVLKENQYIYNEIIACASIKWNYPNLLAVTLEKKNSCIVNKKNFSDNMIEYASSATLHTIQILISYKVKINVRKFLEEATRKNNDELVKYLLITYSKNEYKNSDLVRIAVNSKSWNVVKLLIEKGWNIKKMDLIIKVIEDRQFEIAEEVFQKHSMVKLLKENSLVFSLHQAIREKDNEIVNYIVNLGIDINIKDNWRQTLLHVAVESNCTEMVKLILKKKPKFIEDKNGKTPTGIAALIGNIEIVSLLPIDKRKNCEGQTLLHIASMSGHIEMVKYIYSKIKGVNENDNYGWTPICYAALNGNFEVFEFLLNAGANITDVETVGETLLHLAARGGNCKIIKCLLDKGLDDNAKDKYGRTPLMWAAEKKQLNTVKYLISKGAQFTCSEKIWECFITSKNGLINVIELLKYGTDLVNQELTTSEYCGVLAIPLNVSIGETPLTLAIKLNQLKIAKYLLDHGANVNNMRAFCEAAAKEKDMRFLNLLFDKGFQLNNATNYEQLNASLIAFRKFEAINVLLSHNVHLNIEDIFWHAIDSTKPRTVKLCIEKGVNVNATNEKEETALLYALKQGSFDDQKKLETVKHLIRNGADINSISKSGATIWKHLYWSDKDLIDLIFSKNVNTDLTDEDNNTPLFYAIKNKNCKAINALMLRVQKFNLNALVCALECDDILTIQSFFQKGFQPLIKENEEKILSTVGLRTKNIEIVKLCLNNELNVDASNKQEETALFLAIKNKNIETAKFLISNNADVNCITASRETIWEYLEWNNKSLLDLIMSKNVHLELENRYGLTPLFYAIYYKDMNSVNLLLSSYGIDVTKETKLIGSIVTKNLKLFYLLEKKGLIATSNALRKYKEIFLENKNISSVIENTEDLYVRLHFAVYAGNISQVKNILQKSIDLQSVDTYNSRCPLDFAVKNNLLDSRLLIEKTKWIRSIYEEKKIWTIEDMREYLLQIITLNHSTRKHQFKHPYFTKEVYDNFLYKPFR